MLSLEGFLLDRVLTELCLYMASHGLIANANKTSLVIMNLKEKKNRQGWKLNLSKNWQRHQSNIMTDIGLYLNLASSTQKNTGL